MSFEEELRRAVDSLAAVAAEHATEVAQSSREAEETIERVVAARLADAQMHAHEAGLAQGREEGRATIDRLAEAVRLIDRGGSLSEILDALTVSASREAARVGVLLVRGEQLRGWRFVGFGPERPELQDASRFELPLSDAGIIADAVRQQQCASGDGAEGAALPDFALSKTSTTSTTSTTLTPPEASGTDPRHALAVPVMLTGHVVAVLYSDQGDHDHPQGRSPTMLEILARHAARRLECVTALRSSQLLSHWPDTRASFST